MTELNTGIRHIRDEVPKQSAIGAEMSVVGLIGTAPNADPVAFPLNTNIYVATSDLALRASLGASGTLENALAGISAQLGEQAGAARVIIRRVDAGVDDFATIANIVGSESQRTGVWGFLDAGEELGFTPRLMIAPGFTSQTKDGRYTLSLDIATPSQTFTLTATPVVGSQQEGDGTISVNESGMRTCSPTCGPNGKATW